MARNILRILAAVALLAAPIFAQTSQVRLRGIISFFDGSTLMLQIPNGKTTSVAVPPSDVRINANGKAKLSDIKPGDFVGSAADKGPDVRSSTISLPERAVPV